MSKEEGFRVAREAYHRVTGYEAEESPRWGTRGVTHWGVYYGLLAAVAYGWECGWCTLAGEYFVEFSLGWALRVSSAPKEFDEFESDKVAIAHRAEVASRPR